MKTGYCLPSGDYNVVLTKEELNELVENGRLTMSTGRTNCSACRYYFDGEKMTHAWKKDVFNCLLFHLDEEDVDRKEDAGEHYVQFLSIIVKEDL